MTEFVSVTSKSARQRKNELKEMKESRIEKMNERTEE